MNSARPALPGSVRRLRRVAIDAASSGCAHFASGTIVLLWTGLSQAHTAPIPTATLSIGPSAALGSYLGAHGMVNGFDAAFGYKIGWGGVGFRSFENLHAADRALLAYAEVGMWFVLNLGVGCSWDLVAHEPSRSGIHVFVGLPIPVGSPPWKRDNGVIFIEPYYRPTFAGAGTLSEVGVMLKWWFEISKDRW